MDEMRKLIDVTQIDGCDAQIIDGKNMLGMMCSWP